MVIDRDLKRVYVGYMGIAKHSNSLTPAGITPKKSDTQSSGFLSVGEILKGDTWQARIRRFQDYSWAKEPKR